MYEYRYIHMSCMLGLLAQGSVTAALSAEHVWGCLPGNVSHHMKFCNRSVPIEERVADLLANLTLEEKVGLLGAGTTTCAFMDAGVQRLGIPVYTWCVETNSGAGGICVAEGKCQSTFPAAAGLAASFNRTVWRTKGEIISTELRALNNIGGMRMGGPNDYIGLNGWGPNINIIRDPRYGRNSELPSEDPTLSGHYAAEMVRGMQEGPDTKYMKMHASLKHYTAYSVETNRAGIDESISEFDLHDTYLPQYQIAFEKGMAAGVMCSYNEINGVPMCANQELLNGQIRQNWSRPDTLVVTDCGAVTNMVPHGDRHGAASSNNKYKTLLEATAASINSGADLETGPVWTGDDVLDAKGKVMPKGGLVQAVGAGAVSMSTIDQALSRALTAKMRLGIFDPDSGSPYLKYDINDLSSPAHVAALAEAAAQSFVLLSNPSGALPLKSGGSLAVVGPHAITRAGLLSGYAGDSWCYTEKYDGSHKETNCIPPIGESLAKANVGGATTIVEGVPVSMVCNTSNPFFGNATCDIAKAVAAARKAEIVVLCLGTTSQNDEGPSVDSEGHDEADYNLPGSQTVLADAIFAVGKPVILLLLNGGIVQIDKYAHKAAAVVEVFLPALQAPTLAAQLYGHTNRWGKLPVTYYSGDLPWNLTDMAVSTGIGRTYRYYSGTPLYEFGHGLSYANFSLSCTNTSTARWTSCDMTNHNRVSTARQAAATTATTYTCDVTNLANMDGDEVVFLYHRPTDSPAARAAHARTSGSFGGGSSRWSLPKKALVDWQRVHVPAGKTVTVPFTVDRSMLALRGDAGAAVKTLHHGEHHLEFSRGHGETQHMTIDVACK